MTQRARLPDDEAARLRALAGYEVLDTEPEKAFDDLVRLAATICGTPVSMVSLVDEKRQWWKARVGVEVCETPRDVAFCAHAILEDEMLVVEDATQDPRFADNPLVTGDFGVRFYAGVSLRTAEGHALGTLCVIDQVPRTLSDDQTTALTSLGRAVMTQLELRRQIAENARQAAERDALRVDLDRIFSLSLDMISVAGTDGFFKKVNPAFTETLGYSREELLSRPFLDFIHPDDVEPTLREVEKLSQGRKTIWFENRLLLKDGSYKWLAWRASPVPEEGLMYGVARDVTELKRHEDELAEARDEAIEASRLKSQFLANMSHELRTPLNSIIGFSELLLDHVPGPLTEDQEQCVTDVFESGRHLLSLINDILDLSKIEAGKMEVAPESLDVAFLIATAEAAVSPLAGKKNLNLTRDVEDGLGPAWADPARVRQVLINLLGNAVKFTDEGGSIEVRARRAPGAPGMLEIAVSDTGIGIAAEELEAIFDEFRQVDGSQTRRHDGTGLGLSLCRKFLQLMGGGIRVESEPGRGSTFTFTLPAAARQAASAGERSPRAVGRVVVIEDDPRSAHLTRKILESADFEVTLARDGEEGLRTVREVRPDVVVTDILMPGKDGWSVLRELKADPATAEIPLILLSVTHDPERGDELGALHCLMKPIDRRRLLDAVRGSLGLRSARLEGRTVLVVDDDPVALRLGRNSLEQAGAKVLLGTGGEEGIHLARSARPDLVILDLLMPKVSGFDVVRALAADDATRDIPILIMTAKDLTPDEWDGLNGHISDLVRKGELRPRDLVRVVEQVLGTRPRAARRTIPEG